MLYNIHIIILMYFKTLRLHTINLKHNYIQVIINTVKNTKFQFYKKQLKYK